MKRATNAEYESRVLLLADAIASGFAKRRDLLHLSSKNGWGVDERQLDNYIKEAIAVFKDRTIDDIDVKRRKRIKQLEHLAHVNYLDGNFTEVRHNIKLLADIEGIVQSRFAEKNIDDETKMEIVSRFSDRWAKVSGK